MGTTHPCSSAHRHLYSNRSMGGLARYSKGSVGDHRSRGSNQLLHGARLVRYLRGGCLLRYTGTRVTEQTRPEPPPPVLRVSPRARGLPSWAMSRDIGAPLQPRSPQPPHASRRAKLRAHQARHENPAGRRLDTKTTPLSPPARTERGPHNRTPATQTPTAHLVDGQRREEGRPTPHAMDEGTPPGTPSRRPRNPKPSRGEPGPDRPPPKHARRSTGPGQDTRRGTDHMERPYQRPVPGPREMRAPHHPAGSGHRESASAHTRKGHAGTTRRATGPSARNAQTTWNGVPASEDKGHPDGTARHTQRGIRGAGRGKKGTHNTRYRPEPPRTGRERRAHTDGTLHPPRQ